MRQRFLLVAGWVTAAVVSSLVATAAVAIAGGQVSDRPLRPLTAAEVAALPVAAAVDTPASERALPDSAPAQPDPVVAAPEGVPTESAEPAPTGEVPAPAPAPAEPAVDVPADDPPPTTTTRPPPTTTQPPAPDPEPTTADRPAEEPAEPPPDEPVDEPAETAVVHLVGGSVSVAGGDGRVVLLSARPRPGYVMRVEFPADNRLAVSFVSDEARSLLIAEWTDRGLRLTEREEKR
jgi:outer membrane biosynthesis protein TonB